MGNIKKISKVLDLIIKRRENDGGFYGSLSKSNPRNTKIQNIFISSLVCRLLLESAEQIKYTDYNLYKKIRMLSERTIKLIEKNRETSGTWNYYLKRNRDRSILPDDLDDTFNSLLALNMFDADKTNSDTFVTTMNVLLKTERKIGDLSAYNTWIDGIEDIDPVVQIITYKFLSKIRSVPSRFNTFLEQVLSKLQDKLPKSKYYESMFYILMELSSIEPSLKYRNNFQKYLKHKPKNTFDVIAHYQTKSNLNLITKKDREKIVNIDYSGGEMTPFYIEKSLKGQKEYCYSDIVTVALYLRLLCSVSKNECDMPDVKNKIYNDVIESSMKELSIFDTTVGQLDEVIFENRSPVNQIISEIMLWSKYLNLDLKKDENENYVNKIAKYTYFGWVGYTIIDSIIDNQIPKRYLPIGSHFLANSSTIINEVICIASKGDNRINEQIKDYVNDIYKRLHKAQFIEGDPPVKSATDIISILENKAIGHSIGFIMLYIKQKKYNLRHMHLIFRYFQKYLSMKQLSDDIHDWKIDIKEKRDTLPTFLLKGVDKNNREQYVKDNVIPKILSIMQKSKVSLEKTLMKLGGVIDVNNQARLIDQSNKYLEGIKQAIKEIEFSYKIQA